MDAELLESPWCRKVGSGSTVTAVLLSPTHTFLINCGECGIRARIVALSAACHVTHARLLDANSTGDSRAVAIRGGRILTSTNDHKPVDVRRTKAVCVFHLGHSFWVVSFLLVSISLRSPTRRSGSLPQGALCDLVALTATCPCPGRLVIGSTSNSQTFLQKSNSSRQNRTWLVRAAWHSSPMCTVLQRLITCDDVLQTFRGVPEMNLLSSHATVCGMCFASRMS